MKLNLCSSFFFSLLFDLCSACLNEWLRTHSYCAYCRTHVVVEDMSRTNITAATGRRQRTRPRRSLLRSATNPATVEEQQQQQQQQQQP